MASVPSPRPASLAFLSGACALGLLVALTLATPSTSRMLTWPWTLLATGLGLAAVGAGVGAVARGWRLDPWIEAGLVLLGLGAAVAAHTGYLPGISRPAALPVLAAAALPWALGAAMGGARRNTWAGALGLVVGVILVVGLIQWISLSVVPHVDRGGGLLDALRIRHDHPFGHSTYAAAFALLSLAWLGWLALVSPPGSTRLLAGLGAVLAGVTILASGSRAGVGALVLGAVGFGIAGWRGAQGAARGRWRWTVIAAALVATVAVVSNDRLREAALTGRWGASASESNAQRLGMAQGAWELGWARPVLGWGPGAVPHVFPAVRAGLPGNVDNVLQVHHSGLQAWVTLGALGLAGALFLLLGLARAALRRPEADAAPGERAGRLALAAGALAYGAFTFFDHGLDVPAIALAAGALVAALGRRAEAGGRASGRAIGVALAVAALSLAPAMLSELRARAAYDAALDAVGRRDPAGFLAALERCAGILPDHPYPAHLRAGFLATGQPLGLSPSAAGREEAIRLLAATVERNPFLEYAWYNLGWLRLGGDPAEAERCFAAAAGLAPHRLGVHLGLGLARAARGDPAAAVAAFATERVNAPEQAFAALFREPGLADVAAEVGRVAEAFVRAEADAGRLPRTTVDTVLRVWRETPAAQVREGAAGLRVRPGYGVLMGFPQGRPPADVQPLSVPVLPPSTPALPRPGWVPGRALLRLARVDPPPMP